MRMTVTEIETIGIVFINKHQDQYYIRVWYALICLQRAKSCELLSG